jgi:hypothetical protein
MGLEAKSEAEVADVKSAFVELASTDNPTIENTAPPRPRRSSGTDIP